MARRTNTNGARLMNLTYETLFPEVLSTTQDIEVFTQCPYKWFLKRCARMHKYAYNSDLEAGSEFAKAMEITRTAFYKENLPEYEAVELGKKHILESYGETYSSQSFPDTIKTPEKLAEVFGKMFEEHPMGESSIIPFEMTDGSLSVEQDFTIELPFTHPETGLPLKLKCKLDMLGTDGNVVYVVDEKTAKSVLTDAIKQLDLLRTQNQFVQYVTVANMNKEKFGNMNVTHVRINKCVIKTKYAKGEDVVKPYDFQVDLWFQKEWWNNLLFLVEDMLSKYKQFTITKTDVQAERYLEQYNLDRPIFPRAYGAACTLFFSPCAFTYHCTSGNNQDLFEEGYKQIVCDSRTNFTAIPLKEYKRNLLEQS